MYIRKDGYYKLAKQQGYRSRAAFKLLQLNTSYHIIRKGNKVLDIGASPGGWMQVILNIIGKNGIVVGIDIQDIKPFNALNAVLIKGDIHDPLIRQSALTLVKEKFDAVVCDVSVNITGNISDNIRNIEMAKSIVSYLPELLKANGNFLIKLFYSNELKDFLKETKRCFKESYATKPLASRSSSSELYMIGKGYLDKL